MSDTELSYLSQVYDRLNEIEQESVHRLGREKAFHFVELANDWIDIQSAIGRTYSHDEIPRSLVYFHFVYLFKEVQWFQLHFLAGNYPLLGRGLGEHQEVREVGDGVGVKNHNTPLLPLPKRSASPRVLDGLVNEQHSLCWRSARIAKELKAQ